MKIQLKTPIVIRELAVQMEMDVSLLLVELKKMGAPITIRQTSTIDPEIAIRLGQKLSVDVEVEGYTPRPEMRKKSEPEVTGEIEVPQDHFENLEAILRGLMESKECHIADCDFEMAAKYRDAGDAIKKAISILKMPRKEPWPPKGDKRG
jgi:hypothetical protein